MIPLQSIKQTYSQPQRLSSPVAFSGVGATMLGVVNSIMTPLQQNRFQQMCIEDIFGFALPRTGYDLSRQYIFKNTMNNQREMNYTAGRERLMMEIMGFAQFWPMAFAPLLAKLDTKKLMGQSFQNLPSISTLDYFKTLQQAGVFTASTQNRVATFAQTLAKDIAVNHQPALGLVQSITSELLKYLSQGKNIKTGIDANTAAINIAKLVGQDHLDIAVKNQTHNLKSLLEESKHLLGALSTKGSFSNTLARFSKGVMRHKAWTIPLALGVGLAYDFFSPMTIQSITRNVDRIDDYAGVKGLRTLKQVSKNPYSSEFNDTKRFAYVQDSLKKGNIFPLLISLLPLPMALGFFETQKIALQGFKAAFQNPFSKGFGQRFLKLFEFSKVFPYATSQQISSVYAMLILSRIATARNKVEFRERSIDAILGWSIWMLATPKLQQVFARMSDKTGKTQLLKTVNGLQTMKSTVEIEKLITNPVVRKASRQMYSLIGFASMMGTIILLGLIEPYVSIKLTEWQTRRDMAKNNLQGSLRV